MAVSIDSSRKAINIAWDVDALEGEFVDLKAQNADDISIRSDLKNDGYAVVTFPADFVGSSSITITDENGNSESGVIEVS